MTSVWEAFETYRLSPNTVKAFLARLFGNYDFAIHHEQDQYVFWIPRKLTNDEKDALRSLRFNEGESTDDDEQEINGSSSPKHPRPLTPGIPNEGEAKNVDIGKYQHSKGRTGSQSSADSSFTAGTAFPLSSDTETTQDASHSEKVQRIPEAAQLSTNDSSTTDTVSSTEFDLNLPFTSKKMISSGANSMVYKVQVHRDFLVRDLEAQGMQNASNDPLGSKTLVMKTYKPTSKDHFETERNFFQALKSTKIAEPHLVQLLGTFQKDGDLNLLMEYANGGDLEQYFGYTSPPSSNEELNEFWESIFHILEALQAIHLTREDMSPPLLSGTHLDVKPKNILVFGTNNNSAYNCTFKLADFGLSHFTSNFDKAGSKHFVGTQTYGAPECYQEEGLSTKVSIDLLQATDIWSLGCVYSEAIVWSILGRDGLRTYRNLRIQLSKTADGRHSSDCFHDGQRVTKAVEDMHLIVRNSGLFRPWDDITERVIALVESMLDPDPRKRPSARDAWIASLQIIQDVRSPAVQKVRRNEARNLNDSDSSADEGSVFSSTSDLSSVSSVLSQQGTGPAESFFVDLFINDNSLRQLCETALQRKDMSRHRFEKNMRQLLIKFSRNLKENVELPEAKIIARFVISRSRSLSSKIWQRLSVPFQPQGSLNALKGYKSEEYWSKINEWLDRERAKDSTEKFDGTDADDLSDTSSDGSDQEADDTDPLKLFRRYGEVLLSSPAFISLQDDLQDLAYPSLRSLLLEWLSQKQNRRTPKFSAQMAAKLEQLVYQLQYSQATHITISHDCENSIINYIKSVMEDRSEETWNWWPLKPRMKRLLPGHARIHWQCGCGEHRWEEVPDAFAKTAVRGIKQVLGPGTGTGTSTNTLPSAQPLNVAQASSTSAGGPGMVVQPGSSSSSNVGNILTNQPQPVPPPPPPPPPPLPLHIFFIVASGSSLQDAHHLAQRNVQNLTTAEFFRWLREKYSELKGPIPRWFGLREFSHCEFYKFRKWEEHEYAPLAAEYPNKSDKRYHYDPKPIKPNPPIDSHEFSRRLHACYVPRPHLHWFHKCKRACSSRTILALLPKRDSELEEGGDKREEFWGLYAIDRYSFFRALIWNVLITLPSVVFFFLWLFGWNHKVDLQNASVPLSITIAGLTLFWGFLLLGFQ